MLADFCSVVESRRWCPWAAVPEVGDCPAKRLVVVLPLVRCFEIRDSLRLGEPPRGIMILPGTRGRDRYIRGLYR